MPVLLEFYEKYNFRTTFFFTGYIARKFPEIVKMILPYKHEVGCHGMYHEPDKAFDVLPYEEQVVHLKKAKKILEDISGEQVISFRAPAMRVNKNTPSALEEAGFLIDSSISSQRIDFFLSFGVKDKIKWLFAPRKPYFASKRNLAKKGESSIVEFPFSSLAIPYSGVIMRISPSITKFLRFFLNLENNLLNNPVNFTIHPNELITEKIEIDHITRRAKSYLGYILGDLVRYRLKLRNLGNPAIKLFEEQLKYIADKKYTVIPLREYYKERILYETVGQES